MQGSLSVEERKHKNMLAYMAAQRNKLVQSRRLFSDILK